MKQIEIMYREFSLRGEGVRYFCTHTKVDYNLNVQQIAYVAIRGGSLPPNWQDSSTWRYLPKNRFKDVQSTYKGLSGAYEPAAELTQYKAFRMNILTPDSMDESTKEALRQLRKAVGNVTEFVAERLQYSINELSHCLALEQIDAVALAIYNAEARNQGLIVGDQTGIGKGRVAASFIRYAILHGYKPIFFTEKPGLFSDIYRDLKAIHSANFVPFIFNKKGGNILDEEGDEIFKHDHDEFKVALKTGRIPDKYDFVCCTYSQLSTDDSENEDEKEGKSKCDLISKLALNNIIVMDEAHNAGGAVKIHYDKSGERIVDGNTGMIFQTKILPYCKGIMYLSATYAKFPKNMPIYAINTCISDLDKSFEKSKLLSDLQRKNGDEIVVESLQNVQYYFGNLPAQEMISSAMTKFGQFIRRERETVGMKVEYYTLDAEGAKNEGIQDLKNKHYAIFENVTKIIQEIRDFQEMYFVPYLTEMSKVLAAAGGRTRKAPSLATASVFSSLFSLMNNILLSLKAEAIADRAIYHLKLGRKPVIALAFTNESALEEKKSESKNGANLSAANVGSIINSDYAYIFERVFRGMMYYYQSQGRKKLRVDVAIEELGEGAVASFNRILNDFRSSTTGLCISPIDVIRDKIEREGFSIAECTGRKKKLEFVDEGVYTKARVATLKKFATEQGKHVTLCYNKFNNNDVDVLLINQSGSTGKSAHATNVGTRLKPEDVKQRVMIIGQAELDVNTEVQKRGRINRTGQFVHIPPLYEYIFSAIPCEKRFMMMLKSKLKSLDANTTSNQKQSADSVLKCEDFFNKYGDKIVEDLLKANPGLNHTLNDPLGIEMDEINKRKHMRVDELARTTFGRMQVLMPARQEEYLVKVLMEYNKLVEILKSNDEFDLEMKELDLQARFISETLFQQAKNNDGTHSELVGSAFLGRYSVKSQIQYKKPAEVAQEVKNAQEAYGKVAESMTEGYNIKVNELKESAKSRLQTKIQTLELKIKNMKDAIAELLDMDMIERAQVKKEALKEEETKLAELKSGGRDEELEMRLDSEKKEYDLYMDMLKKLKPGSTYKYNDDICIVTRVAISDLSANVFTRPSAIDVEILTTSQSNMIGNKSQYMPIINMAEAGMSTLTSITENSASIKEYEDFVNNDTRRDELKIITGNIVPILGREEGIGKVITRFTMEDGTQQNGIIVKPVLKNGILAMPDWAEMAEIGLNDKIIPAVMQQLTQGGGLTRVMFKSPVGNGKFSITADRDRYSNRLVFRVEAERGYQAFLNYEECRECYRNKVDGLRFNAGLFTGEIEDIDGFLRVMSKHDFSTRVSFTNLDAFAELLDMSKYKARDWKPLSYDRNKIPSASITNAEIAMMDEMLRNRIASTKREEDVKPVQEGVYNVVDYSEKAWAIYGDTKPLVDKLKSMGGKFNGKLRGGAGWIVSKKFSRDEIEQRLSA